MTLERLLFASCHSYIDPSSGASRSTREVMEALAARGVDCRVLTTGVLDYDGESRVETILSAMKVPSKRARARLDRGGEIEVLDLALRGVRVSILPTASSRIECSPDSAESAAFLDLADQVFRRFRPQVLATYGGHPSSLTLMARARSRGVPVAFHLRNLEYSKPRTFADVSAVAVPSHYARRVYAERLGLSCRVIESLIGRDRVVADRPSPRYLTFVNPAPEKGVTVVARIAAELGRRRPDIPILVVESRRTAEEALASTGIDLSGLRSLYRMPNTPHPREFYRVSRAILVPSLWQESAGRVAVEAMMNGLPVLASDRGGLPETLGDSGFVFPLPERCTPESGAVPTPDEVAPWIATIERLWDDPLWEAEQQERALAASRRWDEDRLVGEYRAFYEGLISAEELPATEASGDWLSWSEIVEELRPDALRGGVAPLSSQALVTPLRMAPPVSDPTAPFHVFVNWS